MNRIRVSKVENVSLWKQGKQVTGTLHLTTHHIIFKYFPPPKTSTETPADEPKPREQWITYPVIANCIYRPSHAPHTPSAIYLRCRDFNYVSYHFQTEEQARDVYESIRSLTCKLGRIEKLYAFSYQSSPPEKKFNGWDLYDARREFARLGISEKSADLGWRISTINESYQFSPTYPGVLVVPSPISDNTLNYAVKFRSRERIPALTYLHPVNNCSITRCSQPLVGVRNNRSVQDEKLVGAIFATSKARGPADSTAGSDGSDSVELPQNSDTANGDQSVSLSSIIGEEEAREAARQSKRIYGAQQMNLIVDARPSVNAIANHAAGMGSENMDNYKFASKAYLGIENIHQVRKSLDKVVDALKHSDITTFPPSREQLENSGWLKHITRILDGSLLIARQVGLYASHVLIHCSDGWDRTSQLSAVSQLCLDPYYRTLEGFIVLVEKDWVSFGHMFRHRSGFLSSDKWFEIEGERMTPGRGGPLGFQGASGTGPDYSPRAGGKALENALARASEFFSRKGASKDPSDDSDGDPQSLDSTPSVKRSSASPALQVDHKIETKVSEVSPMFHQFLDCTYQLLYQHPTRFEFNERFLRRLLYHLYSCQYGTFLYDSEKERVECRAREKTRSVWDYFLARKHEFLNDKYDPDIDDRTIGKERLLFPDSTRVRWWVEAFQRRDEEMNGPTGAAAAGLQNGTSAGEETAHREDSSVNMHDSADSQPLSTASPAPPEAEKAPTPPRTPKLTTADLNDGHVPPIEVTPSSSFDPDNELDPLGGNPVTTRPSPVSSSSPGIIQQVTSPLAAGIASLGLTGGASPTSSPGPSRPRTPMAPNEEAETDAETN